MAFDDFFRKCRIVAEQLKQHDKLTVAGHYDADGLTSTAITVQALRRAGIETDFVNIRQFDVNSKEHLNGINNPIVFVDMGSGQIDQIEKEITNKVYIIDHHPPVRETENQVNPFQHGINGTRELSASGTCYFVAKALDEKNMDLAPIAIVGAVGDMQDLHGGLKGANRIILEDGKKHRILKFYKNLRLFGRQSRTLPAMIEYCSEPVFPGLTGNYHGCVQFIEGLGIALKDTSGNTRHYVDLSEEDRKKLTSALYMLLLDHHASELVCDMLIGEVYELEKEKEGTELRDAKEFATVLNACGRHEEGGIGVEVCLGDRREAWSKARHLLENHRRELREGIEWVKKKGLEETKNLYYFDAGNNIKDTLVGVIAGMIYGSMFLDTGKPIIAFAESQESEEDIKASARGNNKLVKAGIKLGEAMNEGCSKVGGEGGGHDVAAGARLPKAKKEEFLKIVDNTVAKQLGK